MNYHPVDQTPINRIVRSEGAFASSACGADAMFRAAAPSMSREAVRRRHAELVAADWRAEVDRVIEEQYASQGKEVRVPSLQSPILYPSILHS